MGTKNDYWTKAVAEQGLGAFEQRRQQNPYDSTQWNQSAQFILSNPYAGGDPTDAYSTWRTQSGMDSPTNYPLSYGRASGGKYAGYKTSGDMWNAVEGTALLQRQEDQARADAMSQLLQGQLDKIQSDWSSNRHGLWHDTGTMTGVDANGNPTQQRFTNSTDTYNSQVPQAARDALSATHKQDAEYEKMLNLWGAQASDPYLSALETMTQIKGTPIHDYKVQAGMQLGIDPALVQGRYDPQTQVSDFLSNRNMEAINNYGATYGDYNTALRQMQSQAEQGQQDAIRQDQTDMENFVADQTGMDPTSLANDANMTVEQVAMTLQDNNYYKANEAVSQAALNGDSGQLHQLLDPLREQDPQLWRLLQVQYADYLPSDWDPNG